MLALGLALGGLAFTNMWDLPTYSSLLLGVAVLKAYSLRTRGNGGAPTPTGVWTAPLLIAAGGIALAVLLFLPYHLTLQSSVSGIAPVPVTTRPVHMGIVWGLYLAVIVPLIIGAFWKTTLSEDWGRTAGLALGIAALPIVVWAFLHLEGGGTTGDIWDRLVGVLPLASLFAIAVFTTFSSVRADGPTGASFALTMSALGLMLIMGPELLYIDDAFGTRMNTVFKLYYQAWILLAVAAGFAFHFWANLGDRGEGWKRALGDSLGGRSLHAAAGVAVLPTSGGSEQGGVVVRRRHAGRAGLRLRVAPRGARCDRILKRRGGPGFYDGGGRRRVVRLWAHIAQHRHPDRLQLARSTRYSGADQPTSSRAGSRT